MSNAVEQLVDGMQHTASLRGTSCSLQARPELTIDSMVWGCRLPDVPNGFLLLPSILNIMPIDLSS